MLVVVAVAVAENAEFEYDMPSPLVKTWTSLLVPLDSPVMS